MKLNLLYILFLSSFISLINSNNLFRRLCTPSFEQIDELITRAFSVKESNLSSSFYNLRWWTYEEHLRSFCSLNGLDNDKLPEQIKVSKIPAYSRSEALKSNDKQSDVVITVKVPIHKFFIDERNETLYRYWFIHKWPYEPFLCKTCRPFLTFSTAEQRQNKSNKISFIYGLMQNRYSSIVNSELFETIKRENKGDFFKQEFIFTQADDNRLSVQGASNRQNNGKSNKNNDSNLTIIEDYKIKKTIYVNMSTFADPKRYFLVGMNMNRTDGIILQNKSSRSWKRDAGDLFYLNVNQFYLEYSLCYGLSSNLYLPIATCLPLYVEDHLKESNDSNSFRIADCICWNFHAFKTLVFYQIIMLFVFAGLFMFFLNKFKKNRTQLRNRTMSRYDYSRTPAKLIAKDSKMVVYQIILQIHNCNDNQPKLAGKLTVKLFSANLNQPIYQLEFTPANEFYRPFLFTDDILQTTSYIYSDTLVDNIKQLTVEYEATTADNFMNLYLYGLTITNGLGSKFVFPYSNYLVHRREVHLSELNVWSSYINNYNRNDLLLSISELLPITNPKYLRLSKIEKILMLISFASRLAINPLTLDDDLDGFYFGFIILLNLAYDLLVYMLMFVAYMFYVKPVLIKEYFLIRLTSEYLEFKVLCVFVVMILFQQLISTINEISYQFWKDRITLDNVRFYDQILFKNDLYWVLEFMCILIVFLIYVHFFEFYFYKSKKQEHIAPGPTNSLEDRFNR